MCDYSLYTVKSRLACESDDLVLHRFDTGSIGLCAAAELQQEMQRSALARGWSSFLRWLNPRKACGLTAVCLPPGARLLITGVPAESKALLGSLEFQTVDFTELSVESFAYRDALRLPDGQEVLLQKLPVNLRLTVLSLGPPDVCTEDPAALVVGENPHVNALSRAN